MVYARRQWFVIIPATLLLLVGGAVHAQPDPDVVAFETEATLEVGNSPRHIVSADFDGNGRPDLAVASFLDGTVHVILNDLEEGFLPAVEYPVSGSLYQVATGDLDQDGVVDLVAVTGQDVFTFTGIGDGTFVAGSTFPTQGVLAKGLAVADFDNDGFDDIAIGETGLPGTLVIYRNQGFLGGFEIVHEVNVGSTPIYLAAADLDRDGHLDLALAENTLQMLKVYMGAGDGTFGFSQQLFGDGGNNVVIADFDEDGSPDLVAGGKSGVTPVLAMSFNDRGEFPIGDNYPYTTGNTTLRYGVGDFNMDGHLDVASTVRQEGQVWVHLGTGAVGLVPVDDYFTVGSQPGHLVVADFDLDGLDDIATVNEADDTVTVLRNAIQIQTFIRADSDGNGSLGIQDVFRTIEYLFPGDNGGIFGEGNICLDAADVNDDGTVNIVDPVAHLTFQFLGGSTPPASPFPDCGVDPTSDGGSPLSCNLTACP